MPDKPRPDADLPLDELRAAWSRLGPPAGEPGRDPLTHASVTWMRSAWGALEAPAPDLDALHRRLRARRWERRVGQLYALAAVLLLALGSWFVLQRSEAPVRTPGMDAPLATLDPRSVAAVDGDHLELRSGPVRLVLLTNTDAPEPGEN